MRNSTISLSIFLLIISCTSKDRLKQQEGFINVTGGKVWYRISGEGTQTPIILLHGGPGMPGYYLNSLAELGTDRSIIFYDQLGCGRSKQKMDTSLMTIESYVEQLEQLRITLGIEDFYLYGSSWGTMLGVDYYLKYPQHVKAMILSSPCLSAERWSRDADTLIASLPDSVQQSIQKNLAAKTFSSFEYQKAIQIYYKNFFSRAPTPDVDSTLRYYSPEVYEYMWGPSEFTALGTLKNYDRTNRLGEIKVPTLFIAGEFDEARASTVQYYQSLVPKSFFALVKNSGHLTMVDNPQQNMEAIQGFLSSIEGN